MVSDVLMMSFRDPEIFLLVNVCGWVYYYMTFVFTEEETNR